MLNLKKRLLTEAETKLSSYTSLQADPDKKYDWVKEIEEWTKIRNMLQSEIFELELRDFQKVMDDSMTIMDNDMETFEGMDWTITYSGKTLTVYNCAAIHMAVDGLIKELLEDYE